MFSVSYIWLWYGHKRNYVEIIIVVIWLLMCLHWKFVWSVFCFSIFLCSLNLLFGTVISFMPTKPEIQNVFKVDNQLLHMTIFLMSWIKMQLFYFKLISWHKLCFQKSGSFFCAQLKTAESSEWITEQQMRACFYFTKEKCNQLTLRFSEQNGIPSFPHLYFTSAQDLEFDELHGLDLATNVPLPTSSQSAVQTNTGPSQDNLVLGNQLLSSQHNTPLASQEQSTSIVGIPQVFGKIWQKCSVWGCVATFPTQFLIQDTNSCWQILAPNPFIAICISQTF